uniref:mediator of RNA polymerase II transcription subunit 25-like isoform X1 n=1 Tax=Vespula vulgaris TaxID=7454 RepID=UPI00212EF392|nr:mediator of RNA polymerase II transcription subunit 25-like isoform X1 [Vespula vulgaris]XP_050865537.1 mediator of RNA polymerase II transcription subunit 25-like isoform X1 [Vespula vulgaris]
MVAGPTEHGIQADVIFVIEETAVNGAYLNDLKTNYLIPTLEYFSQGGIEDREYVAENSTTLYGIVLYHAADCLPASCTETLGPYVNPHKLLLVLDKLEMVGGKGESHANIGEGLATALQCFEDLLLRREPSSATQKHCILICNSPPYQTVIQESYKFAGHTVEQVAALFQERNINLSVLSPRKIPALFKLFEKAGGDLQSSQTKNYAKDPRHLVLLRNYNLKERPVSPSIGGTVHTAVPNTAQIPLSPLQSNDSPNPNQVQQSIAPTPQSQATTFRNQTPQNISSVHQTVTQNMAAPMSATRPPYNPQISAPPNYHPGAVGARATHSRWMRPFIPPSASAPTNAQSSALIAQLTQPPSSLGLNVSPYGQRMDVVNSNIMAANAQQQQQQINQQQQQQLRLTMQLQQQQQQQQQASLSISNQPAHSQATPQLTASCVSPSVPTQVPPTVTASQAPVPVCSVTPLATHPQAQTNGGGGNISNQQITTARERHTIWQGVVEWIEKTKNPADAQKQTRHVPCQVSANSKDGDPELKADTWPQKLIMQLMPKQLIGNIGGSYLKNSKSVLFHPTPCEALESLTNMMTSGFAGCVHFTSVPPSSACEIKVLILLYTAEKRTYLGFIPNDQTAFVDRLRKVIQQQKTSQGPMRQGQAGTAAGNALPGTIPNTGISQGGILMSQTNTMTMGGGQITQNVVSANTPQQTLQTPTAQQNQLTLQSGGITASQVSGNTGGIIGQQRPPFDDLEIARHQNLLKIQQLRQTLEAAQQQEAQYKSQLEVNIQQNLEVAQQQEMQYKQQLEAQQAQRGIAPAAMANQASNAQRMMRPVSTNSLGLRHLLQQQQPQYRQQILGIQQQMVSPRGQMTTRPMAPNNTQNQQFDDVSNYDFLG